MAQGKVSMITSMFNCADYIDEFMDNMMSQTIFSDSELVIIDANKENEKHFVQEYLDKYSNIKYFHFSDFGLPSDPGVYGCWNLGIKNSTGTFITNANLDDRRSKQAIEIQRDNLLSNPDIDLVYYRTLETDKPNESFEDNSATMEFPCVDFCFESLMSVNSPHCQPMWRKSLHEKFGFFNESLMSAADYEMWLRAAKGGSKMKKIDQVLGLYYRNPEGVSSGSKTLQKAIREVNQVRNQYIPSYI